MDRGEGLLNMRQRTSAPGSGGAEEAGADRRVSKSTTDSGCEPSPGLGPQPTEELIQGRDLLGTPRFLRKGEGRGRSGPRHILQVHQKGILGRHPGPLTVTYPQCKEDQCFSSIFA